MDILIYIIVFATSCGFLRLSESKYIKRSASILLTVLALFIPILLAGLRDLSVGTDVKVYVIGTYNAARAAESFHQYILSNHIEIGFSLLVYFATKLFGSISLVLLAIHAVIISLVYLSIRNYHGKIPVWQAMLVFYLMYFNMSLNIMRQWMAMAILLYGSQYLRSRKSVPYMLCVWIASFFHTTGYFGIFPYIIYTYLNSGTRLVFRLGRLRIKENKLRIYAIIAVVIASFLLLFSFFAQALSRIGLGKYTAYLSGGVVFSLNQIILRLPLLTLLFLNRKKFLQNQEAKFFICMILLDLILSQLAAGGNQSWRIALFFGQYSIFTYPMVCQAADSRFMKAVSVAGTIIYLLAYWWYSYVLMGMHSTIPYQFY